jgi:hypothetical protein
MKFIFTLLLILALNLSLNAQTPPFPGGTNNPPITNYDGGGVTGSTYVVDTNHLYIKFVSYSTHTTGSHHNPIVWADKVFFISGYLDTNLVYGLAQSSSINGTYKTMATFVGNANGVLVTNSVILSSTITSPAWFFRAVQQAGFLVWSDYEGGSYVAYTKTIADGWGWSPDRSELTIQDPQNSDNTVLAFGSYGDSWSGQGLAIVPFPTYSPVYEFSITFDDPLNQPFGMYPIWLTGFAP